jgi:hypothetical protein
MRARLIAWRGAPDLRVASCRLRARRSVFAASEPAGRVPGQPAWLTRFKHRRRRWATRGRGRFPPGSWRTRPAPARAGRRDRRREGEVRRLHPAPSRARRRPARVAGRGGPRPGRGDPGAGGPAHRRRGRAGGHGVGLGLLADLGASRGALLYSPLSGREPEEVFLGSDGLPGSERISPGKTACQETGGRAQASGTVRRGIRAILVKAGLPEAQSPEGANATPAGKDA